MRSGSVGAKKYCSTLSRLTGRGLSFLNTASIYKQRKRERQTHRQTQRQRQRNRETKRQMDTKTETDSQIDG